MANVSQLQPALAPQVQTNSSQAPEKDADLLALRLVNKRARLRMSPESLDLASFPGKASLFAIVNSKGWFAAVSREAGGMSALILSPLAELRSALAAASAEDEQPFIPQRRIPISGTPHILTFACNDTRVLLGSVDGSIGVYASDHLFSSGEGPVHPIHVFTTSSTAKLLSIQPNPGDIPDLIAVLRDCTNSPGSLAVELLDLQKLISSGGWMAGKSPSTTPTSISWSPKGKQLALGLQSGDIVTFSPTATATPKSCIPHPPSANNMSVISMHWLSTTSFHTIYAPPGQLTPDVEQTHFHVSLDSKTNSAQDIRFNNPYLPFPGLRPPGEFLICLRNWDPSKVLLFIGDSTSSDIGLIGSMTSDAGESWYNLSLEETSTPSLPLDKDQNDTILLGMDVDLTSTASYHHSTASGEALELPAHPVMYAYASDGTILGWHVLNVTGAPYPGMVTAVNTSTSALSVPSSMVRELSSDMQTTPTASPTTSVPMETSATKPPSTIISQASPFGVQSSAFGTPGSVFSQPPIFGQTQSGFSQQPSSVFGKPPPLGQSATTPAFGSATTPSIFGQSSTPTFGSVASSGGFSAFGSASPIKFGQTTFNFGGPPALTLAPGTSVSEESMASDDAPSFSGLGLGAESSQDSDSKPSIFGKPSIPVSSGPQSTNGGLIKPGTGFGAFAGFDQKSPFAKPFAFTTQQPGANALQSKLESTASTSSFGAPPSFGQVAPTSTFGQPTFGQSSFAQFQTEPPAFGKPSFLPAPKINSASQFVARDSIARDDDSRSPSPVPVQQKETTSSVFSSPSPAPSTGAFCNLQTTPPTFVKPASGFSGLSNESPFFAPKPLESKPVTVFALSAAPSSTPPKASSLQPMFGTSSIPGGALRSTFPPVTATPAQPPPASSSGAFSAFSSSGGGFATFSSGGRKSFSDLLRSTGDDKSSEAKSSEITPTKPAQPPPQPPVSTTPVSTPAEERPMPSSTLPVTPKMEDEGPQTIEAKTNEAPIEPKEKQTEVIVALEPSLESISSSTSSSFVKVEEEAGEVEEQEEAGGEAGEAEQEDAESSSSNVPSESEVSEEEEESEDASEAADEEETEGQVEKEVESTEVPLLVTPAYTRSPSTTPKAEHPKITVSVSPPPQTSSVSSVPRVSPVRELGTTPPDSPVKDTPSPPVQVQVPPLKASSPPSSSFSLAPRSNNRPIRSSPLANAPLVLDGEVEKPPPVSKSAPPAMVAQPATLKVPFGQWTPPPPAQTAVDSSGPKTPPSSSLFAASGERSVPAMFTPTPTPPPAPPLSSSADKVATTMIAPITGPSPSGLFTLPTSLPSFTQSGPAPSTPTPEQGMQAECHTLLSALDKDLENLKRLATATSVKMADLRKTSGIMHQKSDLGDPRKWFFGDIEEYGRALVDVQVDVQELKLERVSMRKTLKELDSNVLKVNTRKEEIARFNKAKTDAEFAKMLKVRTLAPEYLETQSQLRKDIRVIKDRVQKLEDHLQASKRRINELRTGRPSIKPPSLDTVNRTFRNIAIAIDQQKQEASQLRHRMTKLEIPGSTQEQLAVPSVKRPANVTPNIAITTAAALNAERSARRLKKALLTSRTQPLLNTMATASPVPTSFQTPQKKGAVVELGAKAPDTKAPEGVFTLPTTPMSFPPALPDWSPPPPSQFGDSVTHDISPSRNRGGIKYHQKPIALKKSPSSAGSTMQPSPFEWRPVEPVRPVSSLPFALRPTGSS